jgi:hypothetical protein
MGVLSAVSVAEIKARGSIDTTDVLRLRRIWDGDGRITAEDAEAILALNDACPVQDPAWADWFVETLTDFIVDQASPEGYLTLDNATWLIARIARGGRVVTGPAMDLVLGVLDRARWVPPGLVCFALDQVKHSVIDPARLPVSGEPQRPGTVGGAQVELLRRILCAFDGDGRLPVTKPEAEVLLEIDEATSGCDNHPAWRDLFVRAMANCALAASGYATPRRELALARDPWLHWCRRTTLGRQAAGPGFSAVLGSYRLATGAERDIARLARQKIEIVTHEPLALAEARWLARRIAADGRPSPNAHALLLLLRTARPALHPSLQRLVDEVATA